jgi:hypothetical protein
VEAAGRRKINPEIFWLVVIFFLAVGLRTVAVLTRDMIQFDETTYARMAENLLLGHQPLDITGTSATHFSILYPLVTAAFAVFHHNYAAAGYAVTILFSSLIILPTYMFGKVMWNRRVATASAVLVAVLPVLVDKGSLVDGQSVFAFWLMCALFFGYRMQFTKRCMCGMLSGTCLGLAYLDDPSALYYLVTLFTLLVIVGFRQELANYANKAAVHFLLLFLVFAIPNIVFMTWETSKLTLNDRPTDQIYASIHNLKPGTLASEREMMGLDANGDLKLTQLQQGPGIFSTWVHEPVAFKTAVLRDGYNFYFRGVQGLVPVWLLPLIGLGMFRLVWTRREALKYGYFALVMAPLLVLPVAWGDVRFALPYLGIVMLLVARGWVYLEDWTAETLDEILGRKEDGGKRQTRVKQVLAAIVLVPLAALSIWNVTRVHYPVEFRQAGEWLNANGGDGARVMSREASTAWYSGGTQVVLPYASVDEVLDYGRRNDADYLVVQRQIVDKLRPELEALMDPALCSASLTAVYRQGEGTDSEIIVYGINR